jgi:hypothetical protein
VKLKEIEDDYFFSLYGGAAFSRYLLNNLGVYKQIYILKISKIAVLSIDCNPRIPVVFLVP